MSEHQYQIRDLRERNVRRDEPYPGKVQSGNYFDERHATDDDLNDIGRQLHARVLEESVAVVVCQVVRLQMRAIGYHEGATYNRSSAR